MFVNHENKECISTLLNCFGIRCSLRAGWTSIHENCINKTKEDPWCKVECPKGYKELLDKETWEEELSTVAFCMKERGPFCCTGDHYCQGDCHLLMVNEDTQQCSFSRCSLHQQNLPLGWTAAPTFSLENKTDQAHCPFSLYDGDGDQAEDVYVDEEDICPQSCSLLTSCHECIASDSCAWSWESNACGATGDLYITPPNLFLGRKNNNYSHTPLSICQELFMVERDEAACRDHTNFDACVSTTLPSDPSKSCRWFNSCHGESGIDCEACAAAACPQQGATCVEVKDASQSHVCESRSCAACLKEGCSWAHGGCFRICPEGQTCASRSQDDPEMCSASAEEICIDAELRRQDEDYCYGRGRLDCNGCLITKLPSNPDKNCQLLDYIVDRPWGQDKRTEQCLVDCPDEAIDCRESLTCDGVVPTIGDVFCWEWVTCFKCAVNGCYWSVFSETCMGHVRDGDSAITAGNTGACPSPRCSSVMNYCTDCLATGCVRAFGNSGTSCESQCPSSNGDDNSIDCISPNMVQDHGTLFEACLAKRQGHDSLSSCEDSYWTLHESIRSGRPCAHCLSDACGDTPQLVVTYQDRPLGFGETVVQPWRCDRI